MKRGIIISIVAVIVIGVGFFIVNSRKDDKKSNTTSNSAMESKITDTATKIDPNTVTIKSLKFGSGTITVKKGTTVVWKNEDSMAHTVTSDTGTMLSSGSMAKGDTYSMTFDEAGTFDYHCEFHSGMAGKVIVTE